jgi:endonuclease/exonuclease/phosphatase family metal-dependent hydrolase
VVPLVALALIVASVLVPQRAGPVAAFAALAPILLPLMVVALLPLAVLRRDAVLAAVVVAGNIGGALAYPTPPPPAQATDGQPITIMTWNLHGERFRGVGLRQAIERWSPDVIVLEEADLADPTARAILPEDMTVLVFPEAATPPGMVIATRLPILDRGEVRQPEEAWDKRRAFWIEVDTGAQPLTVLGVHLAVPFPPSSLPCPYCPTLRDAQVSALAAFADARAAAGKLVVVAGDFNLTEREVAYRDMRSMTDAARGGTWRVEDRGWLPAVLRLDYVFVTPRIGVRSTATGCDLSTSDHCPVMVELAIPEAAARN